MSLKKLSLILGCIAILAMMPFLLACSETVTTTPKPTTGGFVFTVTDSNNKPAIGAQVVSTIQPASQSKVSAEVTSADGVVSFKNLIPGDYSFTFTYKNCRDMIINSNVVAGSDYPINISMPIITVSTPNPAN